MSIAPGTRVGPYEVIGPIGSGGMGEVYRARDPRLGRDVALKTLPAPASSDADRLARFRREAQILAALNHAHIASIYGLEETGGSQVLILELVEGGTLADRLSSGPLPVREALVIARQVADGLQAAHDMGIIHRDLKPANIALTKNGQAKVLDFGVAKTFARDPDGVTAQHDPTREGIVVGTVAYMSPEQTRGVSIDKRTDIWAFGCVLYEMLTGGRAFGGETVSDVVAAVLAKDPDWPALPGATPSRVRWLVRRCLEKDPARRLHDIADARIELDEALTGEPAEAREAVSPAPPARGTSSRTAWTVAAAALAALAGILFAASRGAFAPAAENRTFRASIVLPDQIRLAPLDPAGRFALSPDGRYVALVASEAGGQAKLWIRALDGVIAQPLAGTDGASYPFWSPDSRSIAFIERTLDQTGFAGRLKRISLAGGSAVTLCETAFGATGSWSSDDVILFTPRGDAQLYRVPATGGTPVAVTTLDTALGEVQHSYPSFLPGSRRFLFSTVGNKTGGATDPGGVYVASLDPGFPVKLLVEGASHPRYAAGHLLYLRASTVFAQPFDPERVELDGEPRPLVDEIQIAGRAGSGISGAYTVSDSGVLAYQTSALVRSQLAWVDRGGRQLARVGDPADYEDVALSPDASRAAVSVRDAGTGTRDLWLYDLARGLRERLTFDSSDEIAPAWSSDGTQLIYTSTRGGGINLIRTSTRGSGDEQTLPGDGVGLGRFAAHWSADGRFLVYIAGGRILARSDLWIAPISGSGKPHPFLETPFIETHGRFSPNGRWLAFTSNTSGVMEVYVTAFPARGERTRVSTGGGGWPRWREDGKEIVYLDAGGQMMSAAVVSDGPAFHVGRVEPLFAARMRPSTRLDAYPYDVSQDGQRFLVNGFVDDIKPGAITLVVNWPTDLRR